MPDKTKTIYQNILIVLLILWQLFIWFQFAPGEYGDPFIDLSQLFYIIFGMPVGIIGIFLALPVIWKKKYVNNGQKIILWILMIISICTAVPPLFLIVRYIFSPLVIFL